MSLRLRTSTALGLMLGLIAPVMPIALAANTMTLLLVPHCIEASGCPEYKVSDAEHYATEKMSAGDILDLDVLVRGSDFADVRSVKSWLKYDPQVLEARSVELTAALPSPTPGEQTIDKSQGLVKIGGSTTTGFSSGDTRIARVTFRVITSTANTEITFDGYNAAGNGHTAVNAGRQASPLDSGALPPPPCFDAILGCRGSATPLLIGEPSKFTVTLTGEPTGSILVAQAAEMPVSSSSSQANTGMSSSAIALTTTTPLTTMSSSAGISSSAGGLSGLGSTFGILQVQNVRVTTKDNIIFLGWQALKSAELAGYNVYYGTVSGKYIQRRSLPESATSLVLRDLEPGSTYYLAVRAVNTQNQESVFSQEVSITVGKPETATAPMTTVPKDEVTTAITGNLVERHGGKNINGETGSSSVFMWVMVGSALIGTAFAFRRQLALSSHVS